MMALLAVAAHAPIVKVTAYKQVNLASDVRHLASFQELDLKNPWGLALDANGVVWIADNDTGVSTVYDPNGKPQSLVVTIPPPAGSTNPASPTGMVANNTSEFDLAGGAVPYPAYFIWATTDGTISGWSPLVNSTRAVLEVDNSASGAVYTGIAMAMDSSSNEFLYVANVRGGVVEKYDGHFNFVSSFTDTNLPDGFGPFGIQNIDGSLYVTFSAQDRARNDGFVDVFDPDGNLVKQFAAHGTLNSPWAVALAPANFGTFSNALLVGNFGDGRINAFDQTTGAFLGQLSDQHGLPITIDGLWSLTFSELQLTSGQPSGPYGPAPKAKTQLVLYFTAGINGESDGLFGVIEATTKKVVPRE